MAHCPHCEGEVEQASGEFIKTDEFFDGESVDVSVSGQQHVQLECHNCGAVLGYLGVAAATGE